MLQWIVSSFISLGDLKKNQESYNSNIGDDIVYSDDAKSTVAIATAIKPILLHLLTFKINPFMLAMTLSLLSKSFSMKELARGVVHDNSYWAAITAVLTVPYDSKADAVPLHHGFVFTMPIDGKTHIVMKSAQDWNSWIIIRCCQLMYDLCLRGILGGSILNVIGKNLLKRGLVQFLYQQDALHPDNVSISPTIADVLGFLSSARDGSVLLLHVPELGCRFSCIELLRHFFLHSD